MKGSEAVFPRKIKRHYEDGLDLIQALVYGDSKQVGKSVFCLKTMYEVYEDWDIVFNHLFFEPLNFVEYCRRLNEADKEIPVITWDDAGVHAGSDLYFSNKAQYWALDKVIQTLGNVVSCLLVTSPSTDSPTSILVEDRNVTVKIVKTDKYERKAKVFAKNTLPWGKSLDTKTFEDNFNVMLEDEAYKRYKPLRSELTAKSLSKFTEMMDGEPDESKIPEV